MPGGRGPAAELVARIPVELAYRLGLLVPPSDDLRGRTSSGPSLPTALTAVETG